MSALFSARAQPDPFANAHFRSKCRNPALWPHERDDYKVRKKGAHLFRLQSILFFLQRGIWLVVGAVVGSALVLLVDSRSELVLESSLFWGIAIGIGLCVFALFVLVLLRPREMDVDQRPNTADTQEFISILTEAGDKLGVESDRVERLVIGAQDHLKMGLAFVLRLWSGIAALGLAVAVVGSVIAMVTAVAALRQVNRIDAQNDLLLRQNELVNTQIEEARQDRVAATFAAQLPSLLAEIDAVAGTSDGTWVPRRRLARRIQALIYTTEPVVRDPEVDAAITALNVAIAERQAQLDADVADGTRAAAPQLGTIPNMRFSPERAQLLNILIAAGIDFTKVDPPFDFSQSDFRHLSIGAGENLSVDLGRTILSGSNFLDADVSPARFAGANLRRSVFENSSQVFLGFPGISSLLGAEKPDASVVLHDLTETNFNIVAGALVLREQDADVKRAYGILGNHLIGEPFGTPRYPDDIAERAVAREDEPGIELIIDRPIRFTEIRQPARVGEQPVFWLELSRLPKRVHNEVVRMERHDGKPLTGCDNLRPEQLEELRDLQWFARQEDTHPKWGILADLALRSVTDTVRACILDIGEAPREPPVLAKSYLLPENR
ncbi:MAG: hypothetical protein AAFQ79_02425 [Pseudomonadota bacterium]